MFKVLFDYGEYDPAKNIPATIENKIQPWLCRKDPFSTYRSGFEIRTYRRCSRILLFHCFKELPKTPYLVKSLEFEYDEKVDLQGAHQQESGFSFLVLARQNGHILDQQANVYQTKFIPETTLKYQQHVWNTDIVSVGEDNLANAPAGLADKRYQDRK